MSAIENLFQLNEIAKIEKINKAYKVNKNEVEFWIHPVLPQNLETIIQERKVLGNDVNGLPGQKEGILKTININVENKKAKFITVISILDDKNNSAPHVKFQNDTLTILNNGTKKVLKFMPDEIEPDKPLLNIIN